MFFGVDDLDGWGFLVRARIRQGYAGRLILRAEIVARHTPVGCWGDGKRGPVSSLPTQVVSHTPLTSSHQLTNRLSVITQRFGGVAAGVLAHIFGGALGDDLTAFIAAIGAEVDEPIAGANDVEVVLDENDGMPRFEQLAQGPHEFGDVFEVQAGGGLVEQKQGALGGQGLA